MEYQGQGSRPPAKLHPILAWKKKVKALWAPAWMRAGGIIMGRYACLNTQVPSPSCRFGLGDYTIDYTPISVIIAIAQRSIIGCFLSKMFAVNTWFFVKKYVLGYFNQGKPDFLSGTMYIYIYVYSIGGFYFLWTGLMILLQGHWLRWKDFRLSCPQPRPRNTRCHLWCPDVWCPLKLHIVTHLSKWSLHQSLNH